MGGIRLTHAILARSTMVGSSQQVSNSAQEELSVICQGCNSSRRWEEPGQDQIRMRMGVDSTAALDWIEFFVIMNGDGIHNV
jgi:hypothetical protein